MSTITQQNCTNPEFQTQTLTTGPRTYKLTLHGPSPDALDPLWVYKIETITARSITAAIALLYEQHPEYSSVYRVVNVQEVPDPANHREGFVFPSACDGRHDLHECRADEEELSEEHTIGEHLDNLTERVAALEEMTPLDEKVAALQNQIIKVEFLSKARFQVLSDDLKADKEAKAKDLRELALLIPKRAKRSKSKRRGK